MAQRNAMARRGPEPDLDNETAHVLRSTLARLIGEASAVPHSIAGPALQQLDEPGFIAALGRIMSRVERFHVPAALVCFSVRNLDQINARYGSEARSRMSAHFGAIIASQVRPGDAMARLDDQSHALALAKATAEEARELATRVAGLAKASPMIFGNRAVPLSIAWGALALPSAGQAMMSGIS